VDDCLSVVLITVVRRVFVALVNVYATQDGSAKLAISRLSWGARPTVQDMGPVTMEHVYVIHNGVARIVVLHPNVILHVGSMVFV
jgi:hypothetical protein